MNYPINITHELIMETRKLYSRKDVKYAEEDFDRIDSVKKLTNTKLFVVKGLIHLYGYKIAGEGYYSGFYDVINQQFYTRDDIENATIVEYDSQFIHESSIKSRQSRR